MSGSNSQLDTSGSALEAYLLGVVDFEVCLEIQQRLVFELSGRDDGQIGLLICEHPPLVTIGRGGSAAHLRLDSKELISRKLSVRWVNRGGGCLMHLPGQLAVYPIVPLQWHGFSVGDYLNRLQQGVLSALAEIGLKGTTRPDAHGVWGRSGQLAAVGAAVKNWTTYHGVFINVGPSIHPFRFVESDPEGGTLMSSLTVERQQPIRIAKMREAVARNLSHAFGCEKTHLYSGRPLLESLARPESDHEAAARAG
ncbi:MAG: hypothetical protein N2C14_06400 [Planctomycetales bacterium]